MATAKKTTTKRKTAAKRAPARKTNRTTVRTKRATNKYRTFKVAKDDNFFSLRLTDQTAYWLIFTLAVLALGLWIINLQLKINDIYDQIDIATYENEIHTVRDTSQ